MRWLIHIPSRNNICFLTVVQMTHVQVLIVYICFRQYDQTKLEWPKHEVNTFPFLSLLQKVMPHASHSCLTMMNSRLVPQTIIPNECFMSTVFLPSPPLVFSPFFLSFILPKSPVFLRDGRNVSGPLLLYVLAFSCLLMRSWNLLWLGFWSSGLIWVLINCRTQLALH